MIASLQVSQTQLAQLLKVLGKRAAERKGQVILFLQDKILFSGQGE